MFFNDGKQTFPFLFHRSILVFKRPLVVRLIILSSWNQIPRLIGSNRILLVIFYSQNTKQDSTLKKCRPIRKDTHKKVLFFCGRTNKAPPPPAPLDLSDYNFYRLEMV